MKFQMEILLECHSICDEYQMTLLGMNPGLRDEKQAPNSRNLDETYLLTACSRVLLEKLTGSQLVNEFPAFYGSRRFITAFASARHLSLS